MIQGFIVIIGGLLSLMVLERIFPDQKLKYVNGWWRNVVIINLFQLILALLSSYIWEDFFEGLHTMFRLQKHVTPLVGGLIAYFVTTWLFYWWHRARHEIYILWLLTHQLHHSAQRIETITSFYKHPFEIFLDSIILSLMLYPVLGLTHESSIWLSGFSAFGEYFYHMNIKTPQWIGYFFQRPESHRIHHFKNKRANCQNYSDLPIWDILAGTFYNPENMNSETGFSPENEKRVGDMLLFKDVIHTKKNMCKRYNILHILVLAVGCISMLGYTSGSKELRGIGFITGASPLPLVFSAYNGVETFSTYFNVTVHSINPDVNPVTLPLTSEIYSKISGPYNRRNVYGAMFSHGPLFDNQQLIEIRDNILRHAVCKGAIKFNIDYNTIKNVTVDVKSKTIGSENNIWKMNIIC
jgi:sterol desaturase/sphingolipid hydroxylase (fatty acid hydroxylase superfamily)